MIVVKIAGRALMMSAILSAPAFAQGRAVPVVPMVPAMPMMPMAPMVPVMPPLMIEMPDLSDLPMIADLPSLLEPINGPEMRAALAAAERGAVITKGALDAA